MTIQLLHGDCQEILPTLPQASVQCIVTSPPYYGLRDYDLPPTSWPLVEYMPMAGLSPVAVPEHTSCLGMEPDPLMFIAHLVHVFRLARPVLADDGVCWLNLGDTYAAGGNGGGGAFMAERARKAWEHRVDRTGYRVPPQGLKKKDLLGIPWRAAFALQADGWYLRSDCIWAKQNAMPESVKDRPTKAHEYLFLLAKSEQYYYNADAIAEPAAESTKARAYLGKRVLSERQIAMQEQGMHGKSDSLRIYDRAIRNRRSVWTIAARGIKDAHFATFPEALVEPCILSSSRPGDTVLDMFHGSGTVGRVAERYGRNSIGIDLNPVYIELQEKRTNGVQIHMEALL